MKPFICWLAALGLLLGWESVTRAADAKRPNIVFILSDDHAYQAISCYGDARNLVETPNIDRIAKAGIRFDRCVVPNSLCGPCRATLLTGKYSHRNGYYVNEGSFDGSQPTFPKMLQAAGYQTGMFGKWHLRSDPTGFDEWEILKGQGAYYQSPMIHKGEAVTPSGYSTDLITDFSLDWLKQREPSKPFMLWCAFKATHGNYEPNLKYLDFDHDRKYAEPTTLFDDYRGRGKAEHVQDMTIAKTMDDRTLKLVPPRQLTPEQLAAWNAYYEPRNAAFRKLNLQGEDLVRWKYNRFMHDYTATVKSVDENVGRILKFLDDQGLAENTIVVYASDQGMYLGEHGWSDKRWIFEESLRTPFVLRWPAVVRPGSVNRDMVSNLDYAETFLDAAGVRVPDDMQGRSLLPILKGHTPSDWRKTLYYHYYEHPSSWNNVAKHYGVVTDRYKLVHFYEPEFAYWELFDLQADPHEMKSVYDDPKYAATRKELETELARLRKELKVPDPDPPESAYVEAKRPPPSEKPKATPPKIESKM